MENRMTKNKPWVSNYPPLNDWLHQHNARCMWQIPSEPEPKGEEDYNPEWTPNSYIECWSVGKSTVILIVRANQQGWDIYSALNSNSVKESLEDAAKRCEV